MAAIAWLSRRKGRFNVVTAVSIIMLAIISFLFQLHSCFPCGDTNSLLLAKISRCKLSPVTLSKNTLVNLWICIAGQVTALVQTMRHHEFKHPQSISVANRVTACFRNTAQTVDSLQIMDLHYCQNTAQTMDSMDPHCRRNTWIHCKPWIHYKSWIRICRQNIA